MYAGPAKDSGLLPRAKKPGSEDDTTAPAATADPADSHDPANLTPALDITAY